MSKTKVIIDSFKRGEVSDFVFFNREMNEESHAQAKKIQNLLVSPQGSLIRRAGSEFISSIYHNQDIKMISFEDKKNSILIEAYKGVFRFYQNGKPLIKNFNHYTINTPYDNEEKFTTLSWVFDSVNMCVYLFSEVLPPKVLIFDSEYNFSIKDFEYKGGPYGDINKNETTLSINALSGVEKFITASTDLFSIKDVGLLVRIAHNGIWGEAKITGFADSKKVKVDIIENFAETTQSKFFSLSVWGNKGGYPSKGVIFNGRLYLSSTKEDKRTIWASKLWDYNDFSPITRTKDDNVVLNSVAYDNAISIKLLEGDSILWLNSNKDNVLFGTQKGVYNISAMNPEEAVSPYNYMVNQISDQSSSDRVLSSGYFTIHSDYHNKNLFSVEIIQNKLLSMQNINFFAKHLFKVDIKNMSLVLYPFKMLWVLLEDGSLACATILNGAEGSNYAWHRHILGGNDAKILNFASTYDKNFSYLWLYVSRKVNNMEIRSMEVLKFSSMEELYDFSFKNINTYYLDCHKEGILSDNKINNLDDFNGFYIGINSKDQDIYFEEHLVNSGSVVLKGNYYENEEVVYGYNFTSIYESDFLEDSNSSSLFCFKKFEEISVSALNSRNITLEASGKSYLINNDKSLKGMIKPISLDTSWEQFLKITLKQDKSYPMMINAIKVIFRKQNT